MALISYRSTSQPRRAAVRAASGPASPPPITRILIGRSPSEPVRGWRRRFPGSKNLDLVRPLFWAYPIGGSQFDLRQPMEGFAAQADVAPGVQEFGTHGAIEVDRRGVPVEHFPLQAGTALLNGDGGDAFEQCFADAQPAELGLDEQVFKIESRPAHPGGVVEEVESEARGLMIVFCYEAEIERVGAKAVFEQVGFGGGHRFRLAFVGSKGAYERENLRNIGRSSRANERVHASILDGAHLGADRAFLAAQSSWRHPRQD